MNDIETRLRVDAKRRIEPPPDLNAAVTTATTHRPRSHAWLAAAAAVVVVAGGASALTLRHPHSGSPSAAGPSSSMTDQMPVDASIVGAIIAPQSESSREITLIIREPGPDASTCPKSIPSVTESPTEIRFKLGKPSADSLEPGSCFVDLMTPDGAVVKRVRMNRSPTLGVEYGLYLPAIDQPIGTRALIDDATDQPIKVLDANPPTPDRVPEGYTVRPPDNPMSSVWLDFQPGALAPLAVQRTYRNPAGDRLVFVTAASDQVTPGAQIVDHSIVDGYDATVTESPHTRCVTWATTPERGMQVCSDIGQAKPAPSTADLISEAVLLQLANSLH